MPKRDRGRSICLYAAGGKVQRMSKGTKNIDIDILYSYRLQISHYKVNFIFRHLRRVSACNSKTPKTLPESTSFNIIYNDQQPYQTPCPGPTPTIPASLRVHHRLRLRRFRNQHDDVEERGNRIYWRIDGSITRQQRSKLRQGQPLRQSPLLRPSRSMLPLVRSRRPA